MKKIIILFFILCDFQVFAGKFTDYYSLEEKEGSTYVCCKYQKYEHIKEIETIFSYINFNPNNSNILAYKEISFFYKLPKDVLCKIMDYIFPYNFSEHKFSSVALDDFFLEGFKGKNLSLKGLYITKIGNNFLSNANSLENLDMRGLQFLESIGDNFLKQTKLKELDLSGCFSVKKIGNGFLYNACQLREINLESFHNLENVGTHFLSNCFYLKNLDLSSFKNIREIGDYFLYQAISLQDINFMKNKKSISLGSEFLSHSGNFSLFPRVFEKKGNFLLQKNIADSKVENENE